MESNYQDIPVLIFSKDDLIAINPKLADIPESDFHLIAEELKEVFNEEVGAEIDGIYYTGYLPILKAIIETQNYS